MTSNPRNTALIVVDVQNDFLPGGALPVPNGDDVLRPIDLLARGELALALIVATRDIHPSNHCSFIQNGGTWPPHCLKGTTGAELHPIVALIADRIIVKGENPNVEQYSGFAGTHLADMLKAEGYKRVVIVGLATDYCVKATAIDAVAAGFATDVVLEACRAVNLDPDDENYAISDMLAAGVSIRAEGGLRV